MEASHGSRNKDDLIRKFYLAETSHDRSKHNPRVFTGNEQAIRDT